MDGRLDCCQQTVQDHDLVQNLSSANIALALKKKINKASRRPPHIQAGLRRFTLTKPKEYLVQGDIFCWLPDTFMWSLLGRASSTQVALFHETNVGRLLEVTVVREQPGIPGRSRVNQQEKGMQGQEIKSQWYNDF